MKHYILIIILAAAASFKAFGQPVPSPEENIPFLVTFGNRADSSWGDPDYSQIFFFIVPETYRGEVFIRVFDPDVGGMHDELNGVWDTQVTYSIYGGREAFTHPEAQQVNPKGNFKTGTLLSQRTFGQDPRWDNNWFTFGPFPPTAGEHVPQEGGYIFKVVCEGISGDDGNMYQYFMSSSGTANIPIEGGNAFAYEYKFRLHGSSNQISHIYPYVDPETIRIFTQNFDWDNDGRIRVTSEVRRELLLNVSGDNEWADTEFVVMDGEKGKSLNFQFIPRGIRNNNVVINVRNQRGEFLRFYASPIGGIPRYRAGIQTTPSPRTPQTDR